MRTLPLLLLTSVFAFAFSACGEDEPDGGLTDTGSTGDAGTPDLGSTPDMGTPDMGTPDMGTPDTGVDAGGPVSIVFLHTNDEHSQHLGFSPTRDDWSLADGANISTDPDIKGGVFRRAATLERLSTEASRAPYNSPVVKVSAGDVSMGSLFELGNLFVSPDFAIQETALSYNVMTLGNHEFDFGVATLASMVSQGHLDPLAMTFSVLRTPMVVSNIRFSMTSASDDELASFWGTQGMQGKPLRRTHVQRFGDVTVGFVGVMGLEAALVAPFKSPVTFSLAVDANSTCTSDSECNGSICIPPASDPVATTGRCALDPTGRSAELNFPALVADIAGAVAEVRAQNVDLVVAVSHAGINERELATLAAMSMGPENAVASEEIILAKAVDQALAANNMRGIDVIIGGHSHTPLQAPLVIPNARSGINTYIVQAGSYGQWVGKLRITRDPGQNWALDTAYSGLTTVNGATDQSTIPQITGLILDGLIGQLMDGLESQAIATANDGFIFPGEQCDETAAGAPTLPNNGLCVGVLPGAASGNLLCHPNRQLDFSTCVLNAGTGPCGNNTVEAPEFCDGTSRPATCAQLGFEGGTIGCAANCTYDTSACTPHFFSLLEVVANFGRPNATGPFIRTPASDRGDFFFFQMGTTSYDVGDLKPFNESNLMNLVSDANRAVSNSMVPDNATDPVQVTIVANGVIRDGIFEGDTGALTTADLFRVLPLGVSPLEQTPGYPLTDFWLVAAELKAAIEVGLSAGLASDSFWLGLSGARVEYDLSRPAFDPANPTTTGRVTRILLRSAAATPEWEDRFTNNYESTALFDINNGGFRGDGVGVAELIHVGSDMYITLFATGYGLCPRDNTGIQLIQCRSCTDNNQCTQIGSTCNLLSGHCEGGNPAAFFVRTVVPAEYAVGLFQELKEFLALTTFVRNMPTNGTMVPQYNNPVPRRMCCVGSMCPTDGSRDCAPLQ